MKRLILGLALLAVVSPARAHFLFLLPGEGSARTVGARAVFSDTLAPDRGELLDKVAHAKFSMRDSAGKVTPLKAVKDGDVLKLSVARVEGPVLIQAVCPYGVIARGKGEPFLLTYYAATVVGADAKAGLPTELLAKGSEGSALAIVPEDKGSAVRVTWQGKPLAGAEVALYVPGKDEPVETKTDDEGRVKLVPATREGLYGVRARHVEEKAGKSDGKEYKSARTYATLTFPAAPAEKSAVRAARARADKEEKPAADPEATKLLADARAARANWEKFPGFTADVEVNVGGGITRGTLDVSDKGKVTLEMKGEEVVWARRFLSSVVGHRLDDGTSLSTPCAFLDRAPEHPLGRGVRVLNDEFHSSYRIHDRQVLEVNRVTGSVRFTIAVLENVQNAEKKYLPVSYVVSTWDVKTEALKSTESYHHTWQRVGKYDLPKSMLVLSAGDGKQITRRVTLSNWKLKKS